MRYPVCCDFTNGWATIHGASCESFLNRDMGAQSTAWQAPRKAVGEAESVAAKFGREVHRSEKCQP